jgi:DNA-binding CsgD family transcriptional regulator
MLQIDHQNGDHADNRKENLRELCPNCHSQTDTYCGKNKKVAKYPITTKEECKRRSVNGESVLTIAKDLRLSPETVTAFVTGKKRLRYA